MKIATVRKWLALSLLSVGTLLGFQQSTIAQQTCWINFPPGGSPATVSIYAPWITGSNVIGNTNAAHDPSYFIDQVTVGNATVPPGTYLGWCIDLVDDLDGFLTSYPTTMFSSCDTNLDAEIHALGIGYPGTVYVQPKVWNEINYILNHKNGAYFNDIQIAIWNLIGGVGNEAAIFADVDPSNGNPPYNVNEVNALLYAATNYAASWQPQCGDVFGVVVAVLHGDYNPEQLTMIEVPFPCVPCIGVTKEIACLQPTNSCGDFGKIAYGYAGAGCPGVAGSDQPAFCYQISVTNCGTTPLTNLAVWDNLLGLLTTNFFTNSTQVLQPGGVVTSVFSMSFATNATNTVTVYGDAVLAATATNLNQTVVTNGTPVSAVDTAVAVVDTAAVTCSLTLYSSLDLDGNTNDNNVVLPVAAYYSAPPTVTLSIHVCNSGHSALNNVTINLAGVPNTFNCTAPGSFSLAAGACRDFQLCLGLVGCPAQMNFNVNVTGQVAPDINHCGVYDLSSTNLIGVCSSCLGSVSCSTNTGCQAGTGNITGSVLLHCNAGNMDVSGDSGLAGIPVTLFGAATNALATNTTDANGNYVFTNLAAGVYYVQVTVPTNYVETYPPGNTNSEVAVTMTVCTNQIVNFGYANTLPPIISVVPGNYLGCNPTNLPTDTSVASNVTAIVSCGAAATNIMHVDSTNGCLMTRTFTIIVIDTYGNSATNATLTYTWTADTAAPVLSGVPAGTNYGCNPASVATAASIQAVVTASDTCSPAVITVSEADSTNGCALTQIFTIIATNACGNTATAYVTNTWTVDTTAPVLSGVPAGTNYGCNPASVATVASVQAAVSASDTCSTPTVNVTMALSTNSCAVMQIFTISAVDACANSATAYVTNTWTVDTTAPVLSGVPAGTNYGCNPASVATVASVQAAVSASDTCSTPSVNVTMALSTNSCAVMQIFTITAVDACANSATAYVTNTWTVDTTAPVLSGVPAGTNYGCNPASVATVASVQAAVSASDTCSTPTVNVTMALSTNSCAVMQIFTITAVDACANSATAYVTNTWTVDTTAPVLSGVPAGTNYGCNPANVATVASVQAVVSASDTCSTPTVNVTMALSTNSCAVMQIFTITAVDACANSATAYVTNTWTVDTTAPVLSGVPAGTNYGCNPASVATVASVQAVVSASDTCSTPTVNVTMALSTNSCAVMQIFTITAVDACANSATAYVTNTWTVDTTAPVLSGVPAGTNYGCNPANVATVASVQAVVSASDTCSTPTVNVTMALSTNSCAVMQIFTITAVDACANSATAYVTNTWTVDTTAPVLSGVPAGTNYGCNPASVATVASVQAVVSASDTCSTPTVNVTMALSTNSCAVMQIFTITAVDACANSATAYVTNTWTVDTTAPVLSGVPAGTNYGCNPANVATVASVQAVVSASDTCSTPTVNVTMALSTNSCAVMQIFTITAVDACANSATAYVTNTWTVDTTAPVLSGVPAGTNYGCNPASVATVASVQAAVSASDTCSTPTVNVTMALSTNSCAVMQIFTITAVDACANSATAYVTNTWTVDTTAPVLNGVPAGTNYGCNPASVATVASVKSAVSASDTCSTPSVNVTMALSTNGCAVAQIFTISAVDACANSATAYVTNTWTVDTTAPVLSGVPAGTNYGCNPASVATVASVQAVVSASDTCSTPSVNVTMALSTNGCAVAQIFTISAVDACANSATAYVTNTWTVDTTAPVLSGVPAGKNLGCNPANVPTVANVQSAVTASDTCSTPTVSVTMALSTNNCAVMQIFTITAVDACANSATAHVTNTWTADTAAPVLSGVPAGTNLGCNPTNVPTAASIQSAVSASDTCSPATVSVTGATSTNGCAVTQIFTIFATNACGNTAIAHVTNTWTADTAAPVLSGVPAGKNLGCNPTNVPTAASIQSAVSASDTCSPATVSVTGANSTNGCAVAQTFTIIATNACGNTATAYVTNTWTVDTTAPVITCPANTNASVTNPPPSQTGTATATSSCVSNTVTYSDSLTPGNCPGTYVLVRTWKAVDACGNSSTCPQVITIGTCPPVQLACAGGSGQVCAAYSSSLVASGGTAPYTFSIVSGSLPPGLTLNSNTGAITGTPTSSGTFSFTAKVKDATGATTNSVCTAGCSPGTNTWNFNTPSGTLGTSQAYTNNGLVITAYGYLTNGNHTALYGKNLGGDENGLGINGTVDSEIGTSNFVQLDLSQVIASGAQNATILLNSVQAGEGYDIYGSHTLGTLGTLLVTNGSLDNTAFAMPGYPNYQYIGVIAHSKDVLLGAFSVISSGPCSIIIAPDVPPTINVPAGSALGCNPTNLPTDGTVSNSVTVTGSKATYTVTHADSTNGCTTTRVFTVTAKDQCGTTASATATYTWTVDTTAPVITCPANTNASVTNPPPSQTGTATATSSCVSNTVTYSDSLTPGNCPGTYVLVRTWKAVDACGNSSTCPQVITIGTCPPVQLACAGGSGQVCAAYSSSLVASGGTAPYTFSIVSGSLPPGLTLNSNTGAITGTPTSSGTFSFTAKVKDATGATTNSVCTAGCSPGTNTWNFNTPSGTLGTSQAYTNNGLVITAYGYLTNGNHTALYGKNLGGDENGLGINGTVDSEIGTSNFVQLDLSQVIASGAQNATILLNSVQAGEGYDIYGSHTLGTLGTLLVTNGSLDNTAFAMPGYPNYQYIGVIAHSKDVLLGAFSVISSGPCSIIIAPDVPPTINVPAGSALGCNPTNLPTDGTVSNSVTVTGSKATYTVTHADSTNGCTTTRVFTVTAKDQCGTTASATATYSWMADTTPPVLSGVPAGKNLGCNPTNVPTTITGVTASDTCSATTVKVTGGVPTTNGCARAQVFIITATNACGLSTTAYVTNTWTVSTGPVIVCPPNVTVTNGSGGGGLQNYCTYTQGGWGADPHGCNPGSLLLSNFSKVYPSGCVLVGITNGTGKCLKFTSAGTIDTFLPCGGTPACLTTSLTNPATCAAGVFAGQVLTLQLNCDFSKSGISPLSQPFGNVAYNCPASPLNGKTVSQILAICNTALGGGSVTSYGVTLTDLETLADNLNQSFDGCVQSSFTTNLCGGSGSTNVTIPPPSQTGTATVTDTCSSVVITNVDTVANGPCVGSFVVTRTWVASDACGMVSTCVQTITINPCTTPPLIEGCAAGSGQVGTPYSSSVVVSGGTSPYTFSIVSGSLPSGLTLNTNTGVISGTPLTSGTSSYTLRVKDAAGNTATETSPCQIVVTTVTGTPLTCGDTATIGFWQNKNGQAVINCFNGGPTSVALGNTLASYFPYLYGANAGSNNLTGKSNAYIAALFEQYFSVTGAKVDAQMLGAALACYTTYSSFGGTCGSAYGFKITTYGTEAQTYDVKDNGSAVGLANNTSYTVLALLQQANLAKQNGTFNAETISFNSIFDGINSLGDIH